MSDFQNPQPDAPPIEPTGFEAGSAEGTSSARRGRLWLGRLLLSATLPAVACSSSNKPNASGDPFATSGTGGGGSPSADPQDGSGSGAGGLPNASNAPDTDSRPPEAGAAGATDSAAGAAGDGNGATTMGGAGVGGGSAGSSEQGEDNAQGGGGGTPAAPADPREAADVLDGFAIHKPCVSSFQPSGNPNNAGDCCCEEEAANENQHLTVAFGGDPGVTYNVTLRIAGVAERYWYEGGELDETSQRFYSGGLPTIHGAAPNQGLSPGQGACKIHPPETDGQFALPFEVPPEIRPADGCYNGFNIFAMTVSAPQRSYYLNHTLDFDGADRQPHSVYETDYTVTIPIQGQAQVAFYTIDGDHHQVTNNGTMMVPDVATEQPYNGNFLELQVVAVTVAK